jgi:hypothetical protein
MSATCATALIFAAARAAPNTLANVPHVHQSYAGGAICTDADYAAGLCLAGAWPEDALDPLPHLIHQAMDRGDVAQARSFVQNRARGARDSTQSTLEKIVEDPDAWQTASGSRWAGDDGYIANAYQHEVSDIVAYGVCGVSIGGLDCDFQGSYALELHYSFYFYPGVTLDGYLGYGGGKPVQFTDVQCRTRLDEDPFFDTTVATWNNCEDVESYAPIAYGQNIFPQTWHQGGIPGRTYHMDYTVTIDAPDWPNSATMVWTTHPYKITGVGSASFNY